MATFPTDDVLGVNKRTFRTDTERLAFLAGCGSDDGPVVEGFVNVVNEFCDFLGDAARDRVGEDVYCRDDFEANDDDRIEGFRRMIDASMDDTDRKTLSSFR